MSSLGDYTRVATVCAAPSMLFGIAPQSVWGQSDVGTRKVEIRDQASGQIVPAMICSLH